MSPSRSPTEEKRSSHWVFAMLAIFGVLSGGVWAFAELADEVQEGGTKDFDRAVLLAMRNPDDLHDPIGPKYLEEIGRDFTALGGTVFLVLLTLSVVGYLWMIGKIRTGWVLLFSVTGGLMVSQMLKLLFDRSRPDLVPHDSIAYTASFPSGHSMMATICFLSLAILLASLHQKRRIKIYFILIAIQLSVGVGVSRVFVGVHWPTDVLAGWLAGSLWAIAVWLLSRKYCQVDYMDSEN
ncbi:phosphatase PAP2 family protein [Kiritimatiellaeota bacterium B1221]|nr:phosphatase PAP2 family protein [Kiritimatiellaeota bacterium B1221]